MTHLLVLDVADPSGTVRIDCPALIPDRHAPLLRMGKSAVHVHCNDIHDLRRLVDDLFPQAHDRVASRSPVPTAFKALLADLTDQFDRAPRGVGLATLRNFSFYFGVSFADHLRAFRVVEANTVEKSGPLAPSQETAID